MHQHLCERARDHAEHFAIARIGNHFYVANDADDGKPRPGAIEPSPANSFADRRLVTPEAFRDALADNADERRIGSVALVEIRGPENRLPDSFENIRAPARANNAM